jgi:hypothetical protein
MKKGPLFALASYAASPSGRRKLQQLRRRLDTPANRQKAAQMSSQMKSRIAASRRRKG